MALIEREPVAAVARGEPTRARYPDETGYVERDGVRIFWERYGDGDPTLALLPPSWPYVHSRAWRAQIPYLARHFSVVAFDPRGNGRSDRPTDPAAYSDQEFVADTLAVMDAAGADRAALIAMSVCVPAALRLAAEHPERVLGIACMGSMFPVGRWRPLSLIWRLPLRLFYMRPLSRRWMFRFNAHEFRRDFPAMVDWIAARDIRQPHSTRQRECLREWGLQGDAEAFIAATAAPRERTRRGLLELAGRVRAPVLVVHGTRDAWFTHADARALAKATGGRLLTLPGADHAFLGRRPVAVNLAVRAFVEEVSRDLER